MSTPASVSADQSHAAAASGAEAWLVVSDGVLRGLNHALSNRIATVGAVAAVMEPGEDDPEMLGALAGEIAKLEDVLRLLRMLPRNVRADDQPVRLSELLPDVLAAHEHHPELRDVPCELACDPSLQPVLLRESALAHAALALLTAAKRPVMDAGAGRVRLAARGDAREVVLRVEALAGPPIPGGDFRPPPAGPGDAAMALAAARWSLEGYPFELRPASLGPGELAAWELVLPTLTASRERGA